MVTIAKLIIMCRIALSEAVFAFVEKKFNLSHWFASVKNHNTRTICMKLE
jgi:hypothetical protein